jgi:aminoglycoside/choline kinase family phosphotransferase
VDELSPLLHALADRAAETPRRVLCHRDFHSRNILMPPDGTLALVDIQDARWGPDSYDLVSILRDAYIDVHDPWVEPLIDRYLARLSDPPDRAGFLDRFRTVAVQRTIKALGSFGYLTSHLGTERYLEPIPRALKRLETLLDASPDTPPLAAALRRHELLKS